MMKIYNPDTGKSFEPGFLTTDAWDIWRHLDVGIRIARNAEAFEPVSSVELLDEMNKVMVHFHSRHRLPPPEPRSGREWFAEFLDTEDKNHWSNELTIEHYNRLGRLGFYFERNETDYPELSDFLAFTIEQGLVQYCASKVSANGATVIAKKGRPLLSSACGNPRICWYIRHPFRHKTVRVLLQNGANPNEVFRGVSCWQTALFTTKCLSFTSGQGLNSLREVEKILRLMLEAGANPHANLEWTTKSETGKGMWWRSKYTQSPGEVINEAFILGGVVSGVDYRRVDYEGSHESLTEDGLLEIKKLGEGLLGLLREKQEITTGTSGWTKAVSRKTKTWQVRFRSRFSSR